MQRQARQAQEPCRGSCQPRLQQLQQAGGQADRYSRSLTGIRTAMCTSPASSSPAFRMRALREPSSPRSAASCSGSGGGKQICELTAAAAASLAAAAAATPTGECSCLRVVTLPSTAAPCEAGPSTHPSHLECEQGDGHQRLVSHPRQLGQEESGGAVGVAKQVVQRILQRRYMRRGPGQRGKA
jgi:hypothetical protein